MQADAAGLEILLVDDDENDFLLTRRLLQLVENGRHRLEWVSSYDSGLAAIRRGAHDICLLDYRLGGRCGLALLREAIAAGCTVPIVLVTGYEDAGVETDALASGAADYLVKGKIAAEDLWRALRHAVQRTRARDALRERDQVLHAVFGGALDAMVIVDDDGRYTDGNPAALALFGLTREELRGKTIRDLAGVDDEAKEADWARFLHEGTRAGERSIVAANGEVRTVAYRATANILPNRHLSVLRDTTETEKLRASLAHADRMAALGALAAGVAHEINNPLAAVIGNVDAAAKRVDSAVNGTGSPDDLKQAQDELRDAAKAAERVRMVVRDLTVFSRRDDARNGPVDVRSEIQATLRIVANELRHRARLVEDYGHTPTIDAGEGRLGQVLLNILMNAVHAVPEGSAESNEIRVTTRTDQAFVVIEISDTGAGIAPEALGRVFEPYFTTKPIGAGTGLGLSICHSIVANLGGSISVDSTLRRGTTVRVRLPVGVLAKPVSAAPPQVAAEPVRRARILIVDDEPMLVKLLTHTLMPHHETVGVTRATEALRLVESGEHFDLILCDLMMPQMTGMDLHAALQRVAPALARRMIFLTGGTFTTRAREFVEEVGNMCLEKPCSAKTLVQAVADVLR